MLHFKDTFFVQQALQSVQLFTWIIENDTALAFQFDISFQLVELDFHHYVFCRGDGVTWQGKLMETFRPVGAIGESSDRGVPNLHGQGIRFCNLHAGNGHSSATAKGLRK